MPKLLTSTQEQIIVEAILAAEKNTSGEIRVHIEKICKTDSYKRAIEVFKKLGMAATKERNAVLIYIAEDSHKFAIIGDSGIHEKVGNDFWVKSADTLNSYFKNKLFVEGIKETILFCGVALKQYFPYQSNDANELSNEITYDS